MLLPATPGWVSLPVVVGGPRHSWLRSPGGGGVWWGCGWCVVWLVPRHSWQRFLCATPRHSWLGFAAGGCGRSSPLLAEGPGRGSPPVLGWGPLAAVECGGVVPGVWCGWSLATPNEGSCVLLPATPGWVSLPVVVCGSPPLLAGACWLRWLVVCGVWCVVCGVRRWCVGGVVAGVWCGWSLATPGGCSRVVLPATPGWVSLPVLVGGPRHSWLRVPGAVPRHSWLGSVGGGGVPWSCGWCVVWSVPRHSWWRFLRATPRHSWLGFAAGGGVWSPATPGWGLLAAVVCGVRCVVCGVWCVVCGGGVLVGLWLVCGEVRPSPLLVEVPVCYSPPLLAGFRCRWWWAFLATPGGGSRARFPATPGWVSLSAVACGVWCVVCGVWCAAVACVVGLWLVCGVVGPSPLLAEVPVCYSPPLLAGLCCRWWCAAPRNSRLGPAGCGGVFRGRGCPLLCVFVVCVGVRGGRAVLRVACLWCLCFWWCGVVVRWVCLLGALLLGLGVCVCAVWPFVLVWVAWGGGVVRGVAAVRVHVCACGVWLVGCGVSYLGWFSSSVVGMVQKAEEEVL